MTPFSGTFDSISFDLCIIALFFTDQVRLGFCSIDNYEFIPTDRQIWYHCSSLVTRNCIFRRIRSAFKCSSAILINWENTQQCNWKTQNPTTCQHTMLTPMRDTGMMTRLGELKHDISVQDVQKFAFLSQIMSAVKIWAFLKYSAWYKYQVDLRFVTWLWITESSKTIRLLSSSLSPDWKNYRVFYFCKATSFFFREWFSLDILRLMVIYL